MHSRYYAFTALLVLAIAGCGSKEFKPIPVSGTVKLKDGTVPQGEVTVIRFTPMAVGPKVKAASGKIEKDGSYKLTTTMPNDGAFPGEYKVEFSVWKTYTGREELIAPQFTKTETTPLSASVKAGSQKFDFTIEAKP